MTNENIRTMDELGRVSIPADQCQALGWAAGEQLVITHNAQEGTVTITPAEPKEQQ